MRGLCAGTHLLDDGENPGLAVVIAVRADTEVDLLGEGIRLEVRAELEDTACMTIRDREPSKGQVEERMTCRRSVSRSPATYKGDVHIQRRKCHVVKRLCNCKAFQCTSRPIARGDAPTVLDILERRWSATCDKRALAIAEGVRCRDRSRIQDEGG